MLSARLNQSEQIESRLARAFLFLSTLQCLFAIFAAPFLLSRKNVFEAGTIYYLFSFISSQITERTYFIYSFPLAVDARCLGLFFGMLVGLLIYRRKMPGSEKVVTLKQSYSKPVWTALVISAAPFVVDLFINYAARMDSLNLAFSAGLLFGLTLPFYLVPILCKLLVFSRLYFRRFFATVRPLRS